MDCLDNLIGLRYCGVAEPESDLYINDLPGISIKSIDKIANDEQVTFFEVWNQVQKRSANLLHTAVVNTLSTRYQLNRLNEMFDLGKIIDSSENQTAPAGQLRGIAISLSSRSLLQFIHVQEVRVYLKVAANFNLKVFQIHGNGTFTELSTLAVVGVVGWNNVKLNGNYYGVEKLLIGYDATSISSVYAAIDENSDCNCCDACFDICDCSATIRGAQTALNPNELSYGNNSFGLSAIVSVQCDYRTLVCNNKALFALPLQYLCARELLTERIHSDRLNRYTTIDANKARELREEFQAQYMSELTSVLNGISLNTADCCISCNGLVTIQNNLP